MEFEIDVSGSDLLEKDYTIVVAQKSNSDNPTIFGYKFGEGILKILKSRYGQKKYKYDLSRSQKSLFKIRLYCIVIFYIISHINKKSDIFKKDIYLTLCKDFDGRENDIKSNLRHFLTDLLKLEIKKMFFCRLQTGSNADKYAYLMRKDKKNLMKENYIDLNIEDFERFL